MIEGSQTVSWAVAFAAGLLSFLSPCVAPVVPGYLSFVTGTAVGVEPSTPRQTERVVVASLLFVLGFVLVFVTLGATAGAIGSMLAEHRALLNRASGIVMIAMGLFVLGFLRLSPLMRERRVHLIDRPLGPLGTLAVGIAFGLGWTPCIGPVLAAILLYAGSAETAQMGALLLLVYSLGLGVPFVLASLGLNSALSCTGRLRRALPALNAASGILLVAMGIVFVSNQTAAIGYVSGISQALFEQITR